MRFTPKVIPSRSGNVGLIQLNNPKALNSLDLDMVRFLNDILPTYTSASAKGSASALKATIWTSNNETRKAFCAGGDMKRIYQEIISDDSREKKVLVKILRDGLPQLIVLDYRKDYDEED